MAEEKHNVAQVVADVETHRPSITAARNELNDDQLLEALGHKQELRREFSIWSLGALCLCLMATWEALGSVLPPALISGGPPCLFYNYVISFLGTIAIAFSLAEIASAYPTAAGQYFWVAVLAPDKSRLAASWFTGWISIGGQIVLTASAAFAAGLQYQALIILNHPDTYEPQRWHGMLFYWLVLAYALALNIWGSKLLPTTNLISGVIHIAAFFAIVITLGVKAEKHDASYVFTEFSNSSGWDSNAISWLVGLLTTVYPFLGYDAACHLAEEMPNPSRNVPIALVGSVVVNGLIGFIYCIVLLFCLGDLDDLLETPTGFPFMQLFYNVTQNAGGASVMTLCVCLVATAANAAGLTSTSRTFWAFARDKAMPFSDYFSHVSPTLKVPVRMVVLVSVLEALLGIIYLKNTTAFNAILSMAILGMYLSYLLPIVYMVIYGRKPGKIVFGWFKMPSLLGTITNFVAICWLVLACVFSTFPSFMPVTVANMNYSVVVLSGWLLFGTIFYFLKGRNQYSGPVLEIEGGAFSEVGTKA